MFSAKQDRPSITYTPLAGLILKLNSPLEVERLTVMLGGVE